MRVGLAIAVVVGAAAVARGQAQLDQLDRTLEQIRRNTRLQQEQGAPLGQQTLIQYGAYATFDYFSLDDRFHNNHAGREYELVGFARINYFDAQEAFVRLRGDYRTFNEGDSFNGKGDQWVEPTLDRAYYRFDLRNQLARSEGKVIDYDVVFKGGRDLVYWGNGLTLAEVLDGGVLDLSYGGFTLEGIAGITPGHTVDIDSSRPHFDNDTRRGFYGGMLTAQVGDQRPFVYGLVQRDYNDDILKTNILGNTSITRFDYQSNYVGAGSAGAISDELSYGAEFVFEGGNTLSRHLFTSSGSGAGSTVTPLPQTHDSIHAAGVDVRFDFVPGDPHRTRYSAEILCTTGDSDRQVSTNTVGGNRPRTRDNGFNGFGLIDTGLAFAPQPSNLLMFRFGISTFPLQEVKPFARMQAGVDFFIYDKTNEKGAIEEPTLNERGLGWEPDFFVNWRITSDVTFSARYGVFFPSHAIVSSQDARQFLFMGVTVAF